MVLVPEDTAVENKMTKKQSPSSRLKQFFFCLTGLIFWSSPAYAEINIQENLGQNVGYLGVGFLLAVIIGVPMFDMIVGKQVSLKKTLFEDDNPAAGLEVGGFVLGMFFLAYNSVIGEAHESFLTDVLVAVLSFVVSMLLIFITRKALSAFVKSNNDGKDLNDEIYVQQNPAAVAVSLSLIIPIMVGLSKEDFLAEDVASLSIYALVTTAISLLAVFSFRFSHLRGKSFIVAFFHDDNPAAGVSLLGYSIAVCYIASQSCDLVLAEQLVVGETVGLLATISVGSIVLLGVLRVIFLLMLGLLNRADIHDEIFAQKNIGAGFIDAGITLGTSLLIMGIFV